MSKVGCVAVYGVLCARRGRSLEDGKKRHEVIG